MKIFAVVAIAGFMFQQGALAEDIVIGQTSGFSGGSGGPAKETSAGARLYFDRVNSTGGVNGRQIVLRTLDDGADKDRAAANTKSLIDESGAVAMVLNRGTPHTAAMVPILEQRKVPLIGPVTGATQFHDKPSRFVFNVRAKYQDEVLAAVRVMATIGYQKFGLVTVSDEFGKDVKEGFDRAVAKSKITPVFAASYDRKSGDIRDAVAAASKTRADVIIMAGSSKPAAEFIKAVRQAGVQSQIICLSNVSSVSFVGEVGANAHGIIVMQVMPSPLTNKLAIAREFSQYAEGTSVPRSFSAMEGFVTARLLVEALKRIDGKPTGERIANVLEGAGLFDLGGFRVAFSKGGRSGSSYVETSMITKEGKFIQ
jgi:branched-chain amino acid transport system substrate-binding protein